MLVYPDKLTVLHLANPWGILEKYMQFHSPKTAMVHHTRNQNVHVIESFFFGCVQNTSLICICLRGFFFIDIINYPPFIDWLIHSVDCLIYTFCWHKLSSIDWLIDWLIDSVDCLKYACCWLSWAAFFFRLCLTELCSEVWASFLLATWRLRLELV